MSQDIKARIHQMIDTIANESVLQMVAEDIQYYAGKKDILDELDEKQLTELNDAISEADNNDTTTWADFKKEMNGEKNSCVQTVPEKYRSCL